MQPMNIRNYVAAAAIEPHRLVKLNADGDVLQAAAATDLPCGVSNELGADAIGDRQDVIHVGIGEVELGGTVSITDRVAADADGKGVAAAPAAGDNNGVVGIPLAEGVSGDIIPVLIVPHSVQG